MTYLTRFCRLSELKIKSGFVYNYKVPTWIRCHNFLTQEPAWYKIYRKLNQVYPQNCTLLYNLTMLN